MEVRLPLVTIFTLVYNTNPKYVMEAIDSIYAQTYKNIEHIIINDNPNDLISWPVIKNYIISNNLPSIIIEHEENYGICKTLNQILQISRGEYLFGCSDDKILCDKLFNELIF
jgi:glycosyltransferase involved in cell wall biosynthesis